MKRGFRKKAKEAGLLLFAFLLIAGCGGSSAGNSNLSDGGTTTQGTGISDSFSSPSEMGVGDLMPIELSDDASQSVSFSGVSSDAKFILALGSANTSGTGVNVSLSTDLALVEGGLVGAKALKADDPVPDEDAGFGPDEMMSAWLRASESLLPYTEKPIQVGGGLASLSKSMALKDAALGSTETFRVLSSLSSTSSYVEVTGEVRCVKANAIFYVDTAVPDSVLSDSDVETLCDDFDTVAGAEQDLFGEVSDVNGDGKFAVLMTKQINRLGALGGGIITGYFYAGDLYERSSSNEVTNFREIIYTMVPDPSGQYGTTISNEFAMSNLLPAVLPHELQHAISYNQHVFVQGGSSEENWLNEGLSHLAEDIMGYGMENPSRYAMYLSSPSSYGIITQGSPNLMERGASFLFMRFMYEQASDGGSFLRGLFSSSRRGVENLEAAFAGPSGFNTFSQFIARWSVALAMTNRGVTADTRYTYQARARASTGNWEGVCLECDADDNRGTTLEGVHLNAYSGYHNPSLDASAVTYYSVAEVPSKIDLTGTEGGDAFGVLIRTE